MEQEKKYVYVVFAEVKSEEGVSTDVLGVFDTEEHAQEVAEFEINDRLKYDIEEGDEPMQIKSISKNWLYYSNDFTEYYSVEVYVRRKQLNRVDVSLRNLSKY